MRDELRIFVLLSVGLLAAAVHGQTASSTAASSVPILQEAALPVYPPIGRAAHITGKVVVSVTVSGGKVTGTEVKSGPRFLAGGTVANLQTWRFASDVTGTFTVTYTYAISGDETDNPTNPRVEMLPSLDVNITARPVKPTVQYGVQSVPATDTLTHESGHAEPPKQRGKAEGKSGDGEMWPQLRNRGLGEPALTEGGV